MRSNRREFLTAAGGAMLLAACGNTPNSASPTTAGSTAPGNTTGGTTQSDAAADGPAPNKFNLVQRFPTSGIFVPGPQRLPVSITDNGSLSAKGPKQFKGFIEDEKGNKIADIVAPRRDEGIAVPYWEVRATVPTTGIFVVRFEGDDGLGASFQVVDPSQVASPLTGKALPPFDTPTKDNHRGVEPYCSRTPPCDLHDITLTEALKLGKPLAYIVGTPAHCQTGACAPALDALLSEHARLGATMVMVHADIYSDSAATKVAPAVQALNVDYEPICYLCNSSGIIVDRLDGVWDQSELRERIDLLLQA